MLPFGFVHDLGPSPQLLELAERIGLETGDKITTEPSSGRV
jgi:hypothetical protein